MQFDSGGRRQATQLFAVDTNLMLNLVNVAIGAILGVVLVDSPMFRIIRFGDLFNAFGIIALLILQAVNIQFSVTALSNRHYHFLIYSVLMYLAVEVIFFVSLTLAPSLLPIGEQGVVLRFTGIGYVWLYVLMTIMWLASSLLCVALEQFGT